MKIISIFLIIFSLCFPVFSQTFSKSYFDGSSGKLDFGLYVPENYDSTKSYPLIMYLHGYGNNYSVYLNWYNSDIQSKDPCFVFTPKTPPSWADWSGWNDYNLSEPMVAAIHVMDSLTSVYSIDTNRLYVYGISMGGEGVFDLLDKLPHKFAAAMSVCGGGQSWWADNISNTPLWMFHGSADEINPPDITERVYNELVKIGATKMRYTNYPGYGHEIWDKAASEPAWNDWMFSFSKADMIFQKPDKPIILTGKLTKQIELSWNDIRNPDEKANKIWYYNIYNQSGILSTVGFDKTSYNYSPTGLSDTFHVSAVNYCFQESNISNSIIYQNNKLITDLKSESDILIYNDGNLIVIEGNCSIINSDVFVELFSLDGKLLFRNKFLKIKKISIDIQTYKVKTIIAQVKYKNNFITKKIIKE